MLQTIITIVPVSLRYFNLLQASSLGLDLELSVLAKLRGRGHSMSKQSASRGEGQA